MEYPKKYNKAPFRFRRSAVESPLKSVFENFISAFNINFDTRDFDINEIWKDLAGDLIYRLTTKVYIQNSILYIHVANSALKHELMLIRGDLLKKINAKLGNKTIKNLIIKS